jgi:predicted house-cleaning noncanonical NTP pyrophosphatase (MazG superfamily)
MIYNKAIRDKIPEIIKKDGHTCNVNTLPDGGEFKKNLYLIRTSKNG